MDTEAGQRRYGRPESGFPDRTGKVCFQWQAGRCNRHRCPFLHSQLPDAQDPSTSSTSKRVPHQSHNLVWRNPRTGDNNGGNQSKWGKDPRGENTGPSQCDKPCKYFLSGTCSYGERCKYLHSWSIGDTFSLITPLKGHKKVNPFPIFYN